MPEVNGAVSEANKKEQKSNAEENSESKSSQVNGDSNTNGSTTSPVKESPSKNEGEILLAQGKRHLLIKDYPNAVAVLADACEKLSELFGDGADECADAYFSYGRALLELAREETGVLGTEPEKEDSEEGDDGGDEDEGESKVEPEDSSNTKQESDKDEPKTETEENDRNEIKENESPADETIDTTKEIIEEEAEDDGKEEDLDSLQLSWEVFEVAKNIYARQKNDAKLAETYFYLGEVQLESENYAGAMDDLKKCIEVQKQILPPDHRDIAETYFQLGVACSLCNDFDLAIENFKVASEILENRIKNLQDNGAPTSETEKNPFYSVEKEITEIKALLPEIMTKIADMEDFKQETIKRLKETFGVLPKTSDGAGPSSSSSSVPVANGSTPKPVTNISHLVRKKRKPEDEAVNEVSVKKTCTEEAGSSK